MAAPLHHLRQPKTTMTLRRTRIIIIRYTYTIKTYRPKPPRKFHTGRARNQCAAVFVLDHDARASIIILYDVNSLMCVVINGIIVQQTLL